VDIEDRHGLPTQPFLPTDDRPRHVVIVEWVNDENVDCREFGWLKNDVSSKISSYTGRAPRIDAFRQLAEECRF